VTAILISSWQSGVFVITGSAPRNELSGQSVRGLVADGEGGTLAIVDDHSLCRRTPDGTWNTIATAEATLACLIAAGGVFFAGTDDARVLRIGPSGDSEELRGFGQVAGRDRWYAGSALIDGKVVGPPLGIRSIAATPDGQVLLANVHVGGIPRSVDGGATWEPTIDIESDVHEVRVHPARAEIVAAASAIGLCVSRDGGASWEVEDRGLYARHCSAVAFAGNDILVSASVDPFSPQGAIYRRGVDEDGPLEKVGGGLPEWLAGKADTGCIAANGSEVAIADWQGNLYCSGDYGRTWTRRAEGIAAPSGVLIL
jgi:hypothetical protein